MKNCRRNQGWWSRLNFNGSDSCCGARVSKLLSSDSGSFWSKFCWLGSELKFALSHYFLNRKSISIATKPKN